MIQLKNFSLITPYAEMFWQGTLITIFLALFTVVIGFCLALILALMRMSNLRPFRFLGIDGDGHQREQGALAVLSRFNPLAFIATAYVEIIRSTPVLVQIFIIYYGVFGIIDLPSFQLFGFIRFERFFPGVVALGMNSGAYLCEIIRDAGPCPRGDRGCPVSRTFTGAEYEIHHSSPGDQKHPSGHRQ